MALISPVLPEDGETADASDVNVPFNAILNLVNGGLDSTNITPHSLTWGSMSEDIDGDIPIEALAPEANIVTYRSNANQYFISDGLIWSALTGLNGAMTQGHIYGHDGHYTAVVAISSHTFTASKDTYIDVADDASVSYTEVTNGGSVPAIDGSSQRLAKVITGASAVTSVTDMRTLNQPTGTDGLKDTSVTTAKLADSAVTTAKIADATITTAKIADDAVTAAKVGTNAIYLGIGYSTSGQSTTSSSPQQITNLTASVTVPDVGRQTKITVTIPSAGNSTAGKYITVELWDGSIGGTLLASGQHCSATDGAATTITFFTIAAIAAGSHDFRVSMRQELGGTATFAAGGGVKGNALVLAEII